MICCWFVMIIFCFQWQILCFSPALQEWRLAITQFSVIFSSACALTCQRVALVSNSELHVTSTSNVEHRKIECKTALTSQLYILFLVMVFVSVSVSVLGKGTQKCGKV